MVEWQPDAWRTGRQLEAQCQRAEVRLTALPALLQCQPCQLILGATLEPGSGATGFRCGEWALAGGSQCWNLDALAQALLSVTKNLADDIRFEYAYIDPSAGSGQSHKCQCRSRSLRSVP